jgi:hypothetical protein
MSSEFPVGQLENRALASYIFQFENLILCPDPLSILRVVQQPISYSTDLI